MYYECDSGWHPLIERTLTRIREIDPDIFITQIKEKFGGLRIYVGSADDEVYDIIDSAEEESYQTCEICGNVGSVRDLKGWIKTMCDEHYLGETN